MFPCKVVDKLDDSYGKFGKSAYEDLVIMEYNQFLPYISNYLLEEQSSDEFVDWLNTPDVLEKFSSLIMVTLPTPRQSYYESSDFVEIKRGVLDYVNEIVDACGTYPVVASNTLLTSMQVFSIALLFIGLVFNILLIIFVIISVLLIYSLLMITTDTKTFDTGIMRLVGLTSGGFIAMILTQAVMFVVPSIICAYIGSYPLLWWINMKLFQNDLSNGRVSFIPGWVATVEAVGIGLLIPTLSAIIPIQRALSKSLGEALNTARATLSGTVVVIESKAGRTAPFVVFGLLAVIVGITIYIVLPQALLAENAGLILEIFFLILVGMILGLALLSANLRGFLEIIMTYLLLFWEKKSMRSLVKKNLVAHKHTNKLTSIIYALTLGCVIFLCIALNLVIRSTQLDGG